MDVPAFAWKLGVGAVAGVALIVIVGRGLDRWAEMKTAHACVAALAAGDLADLRPCPTRVAEDARRAAAARVCDAGLTDRAGGAFAVRQACSAPVKTVVAERDARAAEVADRDREIRRLGESQAAATARAVERARTEERNKAHAEIAIRNAPRAADGAVVCDARCLRALAGD